MKPTVYAETIAAELRAFEKCEWNVLRLEQRIDGQLWAIQRGEARPVWVRRCFPWSEPAYFISLRDSDEKEFALVQQLDDLDPDSSRVLEQSLAEAGFVMEIVGIESVDEEVEIRSWKVNTVQGYRSFQTRLDDWPRQVPSGGTLIRDVAGDLYHIEDPSALDKKSRDLLWAFVD
jgi:hypothetical protein